MKYNMRAIFKKHKWLFKAIISLSILLIGIAHLLFTSHLNLLLGLKFNSLINNLIALENWLVTSSLAAMLVFSLFSDILSTRLISLFWPDLQKEILQNTKDLKSGQDNIKYAISENNDRTQQGLSELNSKASKSNELMAELLKNQNIDPRDIENYLKDLPLNNGQKAVEEEIDKLYRAKGMDLNIREELFVVTKVIFELSKDLVIEAEKQRNEGKIELAKVLENIQQYLQEGSADKIKTDYFARKQKQNQDNIKILKESIVATKALFAVEESRELYKELLALEPSATNHFSYAYYLQNLNYFDEAIKHYRLALKIYRELAKDNPSTYLPYVAMILNNLALLHSARNEQNEALEKYEEALRIYRELAKENPSSYLPYVATTLNNLANLHADRNEQNEALEKYEESLSIGRDLSKDNPSTYLPYVAMTLNNLAILHSDRNEQNEALAKYEEALKIYRELAKDNPRIYEMDYARILIMGVESFGEDMRMLREAKAILEKYPDVYRAKQLLATIETLE